MGTNFRQRRQWLDKPNWLSFVWIAVGWGGFLGYLAFSADKWWWILIYAVLYIVILYAAYKHVKEYQDKKKEE